MGVLQISRAAQTDQIAAVGLRAHGVDVSPRAYRPKERADLGCALVTRPGRDPRWGVVAVEEADFEGRAAGRACALARLFATEYRRPRSAIRADTAVVEFTGPATARVLYRQDVRAGDTAS
ncbi:hypothetical protein [Enorma phocaeensis]|uniref:Uncharacterized protein n=1 Tax=Enorma phocaeensis TaxID=1871019 RepID=A0A921LUQ0_9ACTN|nr:hypothetical protein [Enorma phocaeensis]HJG38012.1 hypothetical protein [Enorma phocaeensis]